MAEIDMNMSEFREELADALAEGGTRTLPRLTDEELAVLDPVTAEESIVSSPHLSTLPPEQQNLVMATALRSLVTRGVVEISNVQGMAAVLNGSHGSSLAQVDMRIQFDVDLVLTLRRTADRALALRQETAAGAAFAYAYIHTSHLLLLERVTTAGVHLFTLVGNIRDAAVLLCSFVDPFGVADRDSPEQRLGPSLDRDDIGPLAGIIDNAKIVTSLALLADDPGPMMVAYGTDTAIWTVTVDRPQGPTGIRSQAVGRETLTRRLMDMLS